MTEPPAEQRYVLEWRDYAKLVAKVWADLEFGERLRANPVEVLRSEGIDVPEQTKVVDIPPEGNQADRGIHYFVLPPKPASLDEDLSIEHLDQALVAKSIWDVARAREACEATSSCRGCANTATTWRGCVR